MLDVIESLAGMVSSMLEFPMAGFLGRLVPTAGSEAGQQVRAGVSTQVVSRTSEIWQVNVFPMVVLS